MTLGRQSGARPAHGVAKNSYRLLRTQTVDHRQKIVGHSLPIQVRRRWQDGLPVPTKVKRNAMEMSSKLQGQWFVHHSVKPGCVGHDEQRSFAAEVMDCNLNTLS